MTIDVWDNGSGDWTRALSRYLPDAVGTRRRTPPWFAIDHVGAGDRDAPLGPVSFVVAPPDRVSDVFDWVVMLQRQPSVRGVVAAVRRIDGELADALRAIGVLFLVDEFWHAARAARLMNLFCQRLPLPVLSLEQEIWKNLPWSDRFELNGGDNGEK